MINIVGIIVSYIFIALIIVSAKFFEKAGKEATRKYIHIMLSNWYFIAIFFFKEPLWAAIVPFSFVIINYISYKKDLISVMERDKNDGLGTVYYAISLFLIVIYTFGIIKSPGIGLTSILIMGYGDGFAAIIGKLIKSKKYKIGNTTKSLAGSLTMFLVSLIIVSIFFYMSSINLWYLKAVIVAIIATIVEGISIKGTDNLTVPIGTCLLLSLIVNI